MSRRAPWLLLLVLAVKCQCGSGLEVQPMMIDFGTVAAGAAVSRDATVTNHGPAGDVTEHLDSSFGQASLFQLSGVTHAVLQTGDSHAFEVVLAPPVGTPTGMVSARLVFGSNTEVLLSGYVVAPGGTGGGSAGGGTASTGGGSAGTGGGTHATGGGSTGTGGGTSSSGGGTSSSGGGSSATGGGTSGTGGSTGTGGGSSGTGGGSTGVGGGTSGTGGGASQCDGSCTSYVDCMNPGEGCDDALHCCVPCGGEGQPCCVDWNQLFFFCGGNNVCGREGGTGTSATYYCCPNAGDGCCEQGGCFGGTVCSCPRNGLNFCVDPAFAMGGC